MAITKRRSQVIQSSTETASTLAATYRALVERLEAGEMTEAAAKQLATARKLLAIAER